jgi:hypothetical protein
LIFEKVYFFQISIQYGSDKRYNCFWVFFKCMKITVHLFQRTISASYCATHWGINFCYMKIFLINLTILFKLCIACRYIHISPKTVKYFIYKFRELQDKNNYVQECVKRSDASQLEKRKRRESLKREKGQSSGGALLYYLPL